ncbi:MAG: 1-(5-phosphoribosyl)-5-[(5-phosphoribosylamino)methylideneamino]imidazole-4-carboxamide isomerase [Magnetococcales bacterium]|nr:1-(5-phosphoribosyl)-5-[(5-phosphoribosylamino)methylideneamino]imidazole-4-carboxamide isomerase [Magnetococcales bacterium]
MLVIPAIDLKQGQCVRLFQGRMEEATVYGDDPGAMAQRWAALGARLIHVVDLDGAFAGAPLNRRAVESVVAAVKVPVELGGGIRDPATIEAYLALGVDQVILGSVACRDPALVIEACRRHPGRIRVGIDARDGRVAIEGWAATTELTSLELARRFEQAGVSAIIFTDISRDGALIGPNIPATRALAEAISIPVILSGGVSDLDDIRHILQESGPYANGMSLEGIITGKALYDGRLDFAAAQALADARGTAC